MTMAEVNQLADSGLVASHGGVNYHPVANAASGVAGIVEVFAEEVAGGFLDKVGFSHILLWVRGFSSDKENITRLRNLSRK